MFHVGNTAPMHPILAKKLSKQDFLKVLDLQSPLGKSPKKNKEHVMKDSWKDLGESHLEEYYVQPSRECTMDSSRDKDDSKIEEGIRPSVLEMSDPLFHVLEEDSRRSEEYILGESDQKDMSDDLEANTISTDLDTSGPMEVIDLREKDPVLDSLKTEIKILTREKKRLLEKKGGTTRVSLQGVEKSDSSQIVRVQDLVRKSKREETEVVKCEEYVLKKAQLSLHKYKSSYTRALVLKMSSLREKSMIQTSDLGKECDPVTKSLKEEVKLLRKQRKRLLEQLRRSLLQGFLSSSLKFQSYWTQADRQFQQGLPMARSQGSIAHKVQQDTSLTMKFRDSVIETLKKEIEQLTKEKEQVLKDKQSLLEEVNQAVDGMTEERQKLQDEMQQYKLEISALSNARQQVEQENMRLLERMGAVEQQQASQKQVEKAMAEMIDSKNRLAYDKGKLQTKVDQLQQELESLANAQSEVVHLRKVNAAVEAKFNKAAAELNACRINMQRTESQLRQAQAAIERKEEEFAMAIKARDEAVKEGQRLLDHIEAVEERERQKLEGYKRSLSEAKQDSTRVASTLEGVMQSHTQLQDAVEALQTELGRKDSEIAAMKNERQQFQRNIRQLQGEVEALQSQVAEMEAMESNEVEPLKLALDQTKQDNMKLAASLEGILQSNSQLQSNLDKLQDQLEQKTFQLDKIKTTRSQESEEMKHEVRNYEERLENLKQQFNKERETTRKRHQKELTELRRVHEESFSRVSDLSRTNKQLQGRIDELEQQQARLKDRIRSQKVQLDQLQKERKNHEHTQGKVKTIQAELESLEKVKNEYISKNKEQAKTISSFLEEINSLKSELKALARAQVEASEAVKHQEDELEKERKRTEKYRHKAKKIEGKRKDIEDRLHAANNESMEVSKNLQDAHEWFKSKFDNLQTELDKSRKTQETLQRATLESRFALQEERLKADEQAEKAKQMIRESRKKITRLADYLEADSRDRSRDTSQRDRFDRLGIL
ncbi:coiled-coil domain-containing protein 150-like isoform X2 [Branchiostoma floridae x Branchiostoma belcheri]